MTGNNGQFTLTFTGRQGQNGTSKYCNDDDGAADDENDDDDDDDDDGDDVVDDDDVDNDDGHDDYDDYNLTMRRRKKGESLKWRKMVPMGVPASECTLPFGFWFIEEKRKLAEF